VGISPPHNGISIGPQGVTSVPDDDQSSGNAGDRFERNGRERMTDLNTEQVTAELEGDFVVFRIGMRINTLWKVHKWLPIFRAMPKMLEELEENPDSGLLAYDTKLGIRNHEVVQYWQSFEKLRTYALDSDTRHGPAMQWTYQQMQESDAVGIWHETYLIEDGETGVIYDQSGGVNALRDAISRAEKIDWDSEHLRSVAERYNYDACERKWRDLLADLPV
jgi:hypothetical protein